MMLAGNRNAQIADLLLAVSYGMSGCSEDINNLLSLKGAAKDRAVEICRTNIQALTESLREDDRPYLIPFN